MSGDIQALEHSVARLRIVIDLEDSSADALRGLSLVSTAALVPRPADELARRSGPPGPHHAAALASVGWYLMMPPTQEQLDSTCRGGPSVMDHVAALIGRDEADKVHARRCDQEGIEVALDAPLSVWDRSGEFETLKERKAEQQKPMTQQDKMKTALAFSVMRESGITKDALMSSLDLARASAKCIATDDPRLKEK